MQRISITNPQNIIDGTAKKYYFKLRNTGGPKGDKGDKGDTGATGPQGAKGDPCTVVVNSTATLEPGSNAYVTNTGSLSNAVLDFGIPKGDKGDTGPQGQKGERGQQGEQGPIGPQGTPGQNATVYVGTTITTNPGTQARVYNTGTENNAVLNFEIPRGAKGDTGAQGEPGPAGQNFAATVVTELPETGDSSKLYLTPKSHTTQTASGNPITATVSEDAGAIESFQLDGDTFQQTYTGKNLFNFVSRGTDQGLTATYDTVTGVIAVTGTATTNYSDISTTVNLELEAGQTFTSSIDRELPVRVVTRVIYTDSTQGSFNIEPGQTSVTWSPSKQVKQIRLYISLTTAGTSYNLSFKFQIEAGATATSFEPFVGGQPSPSPEYPQPIQTVTGLQTISINGTDYPLDLGSIELCKLGTYQDYIWKDGDDWKLHKATATLILNENSGMYYQSQPSQTSSVVALTYDIGAPGAELISNRFTKGSQTDNRLITGIGSQGNSVLYMRIADSITGAIHGDSSTVLPAFKQWLTNNNVIVIYKRYNATDTAITDQTLIAQLEAIRTASLENGTNTITNSTPAPNLAGDMEIGYYGYDPTNRYDKWLWLDLNNNYEKLGS